MSMGFLVPPGAPIIWRGLMQMVQKAIRQLLFDMDLSSSSSSSSSSGGLDILVMGLPPGTGDVPLSLAQLVSLDGSVIVSMPQEVSRADVRKGINIFKKLEVPMFGIVLNQVYYQRPTCVKPRKEYIFGEPTAFQAPSEESQILILAHLCLIPAVSSASDTGTPNMPSKLSSPSSSPSSPSSSPSSSPYSLFLLLIFVVAKLKIVARRIACDCG